jgi:hypothetical protein
MPRESKERLIEILRRGASRTLQLIRRAQTYVNNQSATAVAEPLRRWNYFRFQGTAHMLGLAAGSTWSRLTLTGHRATHCMARWLAFPAKFELSELQNGKNV